MASTLFFYRICLICISLDWKFSPEFIFVHLGVIRGHLTGSKKVIWGQKSKIRPNSNDMHIIRLEIFSRVHFFTSRGHPRSSYGVKKGHLGSKISSMAKYTWYAYHSIGNFLLNPMVCISRSFEGSSGVKKGHFREKMGQCRPNTGIPVVYQIT